MSKNIFKSEMNVKHFSEIISINFLLNFYKKVRLSCDFLNSFLT